MSLLTSVLLAIQLMVLVSGQLPTVSITTTDTTVPPPACVPNITTAIDIEAILYQLNNGELPIQDPNNVPFPIAPLDCEKDGPIMVTHTEPDEQYRPEIRKGSCDNLFCQDPPCYARKKIRRKECVHVLKKIDGFWTDLGPQFRFYDYHLKCGCKQCEDIKNQQECNLKPCANCQLTAIFFPNMRCIWNGLEGCICSDA